MVRIQGFRILQFVSAGIYRRSLPSEQTPDRQPAPPPSLRQKCGQVEFWLFHLELPPSFRKQPCIKTPYGSLMTVGPSYSRPFLRENVRSIIAQKTGCEKRAITRSVFHSPFWLWGGIFLLSRRCGGAVILWMRGCGGGEGEEYGGHELLAVGGEYRPAVIAAGHVVHRRKANAGAPTGLT